MSAAQPRRQILPNVFLAVEFSACTLAGHVTNLAEDGTLEPRAIEFPYDRPRNPGIAVGIAAIEFVLVVETDGKPVGLGR